MPRTPARVLLAVIAAAGTLPTAGCANEAILHKVTTAPSPSAVRTPAAHASPAAAPVLTPAQAQSALLTDADLGAPGPRRRARLPGGTAC